MDSVVLHVFYSCKSAMAEDFVRALKEEGLQALVRAEEGCLQYDYHLSCEEEDTVVLLEHWANAAALEKHSASPVMERIQALKERYVRATRVERFP